MVSLIYDNKAIYEAEVIFIEKASHDFFFLLLHKYKLDLIQYCSYIQVYL